MNTHIQTKTNGFEKGQPNHRLRVYPNIVDLIANEDNPTPLVRLNHINPNPNFQLYLKLERFNPFGSVKDRVALEMLRGLDADGKTIIEPSSGNTGLALAAIANTLGVPIEIAVPSGIPEDKKIMLRLLGVKLWETDDALCPRFPSEGARGLVDAILRSPATRDGYISPNQYENELNVRAHYRNTGPEIWRQTGGELTHFFAGFGTCGTISGVGKYLKEQNPGVKIVGVEPASTDHKLPGLKRISGLPSELVPKILDQSVIDAQEEVTDAEAYDTAIALARKEGILVGPTTGAILAVALRYATTGIGIAVVISPDDAFKYGSFYRDYLNKEASERGN
ncbi:Cysteine synthase [Dehalogenimonas alkenigignens]|uniref:Cysteine synthase n=1 Tax=Dehalogenimonas alkenigignens TaxID=1217799 RepID=A0A0W0GL86_9CHLR|nr:cysteine synthase family protein [Dehalogenimonas alkenigignens]KTB49298.1 Cysteine synthase [Dehalogenimonas alkenigignens]